MNLFVLIGKPVYRRWFLDGSDRDVRLVGLCLLCLTPTFGFFVRQRLPFLALSNSEINFQIDHSLFHDDIQISASPQTYAFAFLTAAGGITLIALNG